MAKDIVLMEFQANFVSQFEKSIKNSQFELVGTFEEGGQLLKQVEAMAEPPEMAVISLMAGHGMDGVATIKEIAKRKLGIKTLITYTIDSKMRLVEGLKAGALDRIKKPFEREDVVKRLTKVHLMKMGAGSGGFFRSSIRLTTPLPILFSSGGFLAKKHDGRTLDISPEGAKIQTNVLLTKGSTLTIILDIPTGGRIKAQARVANVQHDKLHSSYEAGVEFVKISDKDKEKLSNYIMLEASKV